MILVFKNQWHKALDTLQKTNNFPEFTSRVCPAPCEGACVLGISEPAVAIKNIEAAIIDNAFDMGLITSYKPQKRTGKKIAIIGSGPAGLTAADELNKKGHSVVIFERDDRVGGLLMYGIPNMKLDKKIVTRRIDLLKDSGIEFMTRHDIGKNIALSDIKSDFNAILFATGATKPYSLGLKNDDAKGVHTAMEYLVKNTKSLLDTGLPDNSSLSASNKRVVVIGGGDTGQIV